MRRADLSPVLPDSDGPPLAPAYAESDVGSSPRSVGGAGSAGAAGRSGSLTEEPPPPARWDDAAFARVKLMCSYGGRILPRPHDNQLRYVGGESRIAVVSRNITFSELTVKLSRMFGSSVVIKYQLPYEDLDALISVTSDEDLENMMEEYDRLQALGNRGPASASSSARLRIFLFPSKLERSQTASLSEMMENNHSRERWFVDILNGLPVLSRVRSDTSSVLSETPDYNFQASNVDALEEWAAAASYGNFSAQSSTDPFVDNKQESSVSPAALFGSLLQQAVPNNEVASAPGSPSPLKAKPVTVGSSSSAPPAVISLLSSMVDAASKGLPTPVTEADGSTGSFISKIRVGSGDSSGSIPEQKKHVDRESLLTSDKNILNNSVGGAERLLPAGLMDDDESSQIYSAKGSFGEVSDSSETAIFDAGIYQAVPEPSRALKGDLMAGTRALVGQPIFDDELSATQMLAQNLNVLQLDEKVPSPTISSPSSTSTAAAPLPPSGLAPPQPVISKFGSDDKSKHHIAPVSLHAVAQVGSEDKVRQQIPARKGDADDGLTRQVAPAHNLLQTQQPSQVAGEETSTPQVLGAKAIRSAETVRKAQATSGTAPPAPSSLMPHAVEEQKLAATPMPDFFYQQSPAHGLESPISATTYVSQAPGIQVPVMLQNPFPVPGVVTNPLPSTAVPLRPANVVAAGRPVARPQTPPGLVTQHAPLVHPQVRTTSPPPVVPSKLVSNVNQSEALKGHAPMASHVGSATVVPSTGEGVRNIPYQQHEMMNLQRQVNDPGHGQKLGVMAPQLGSQFTVPNLNVPLAPGMPSRFRAMGHPLQQVVEGIPLQQAPLVGVISDSKVPSTPMQRAGMNPSARPPSAPAAQYSFFVVDQPNTIPQSTAPGGGPRYNAPSNIPTVTATDTIPFAGANPFADNFQVVTTYPDVLEIPPAEKQQRHPIR